MLDKVGLVVSIWVRFARVKALLGRGDLPGVTRELGKPPSHPRRGRHPIHLGRAVWKALSPGPLRPRCLPVALVHYRLLIEQGLPAELVIGLPDQAERIDAHAWVEIDGIDVGPPPGRGGRVPLARYGPEGPASS
jgi:hypothetical protein